METQDKKEYEIAYLARTEEDAAHIVALVREAGEATSSSQGSGGVKEERSAAKIKLAYEIDKETDAYFGVLRAELLPAAAKGLEETLRMDKRVLRSMVIVVDIKGMKKGSDVPHGEGASPRPSFRPSPIRPSEPRTAPLSNEALEKKIEEILQ
jgi:ribosomal protein S6